MCIIEKFRSIYERCISNVDTGAVGTSDLRSVRRATWDARSKWYDVGLELGIDPGTLDSIKSNNDSNESRFTAVLLAWLRTVRPRPTLTALAEALRSPTVGCGHLAEQILSLK